MRRLLSLRPLTLLLIAIILVAAAFAFVMGSYEGAGPLTRPRTVTLEPGSSARAIAAKLAQEGVIASERMFLIGIWLSGKSDALKPGEYELPAHISEEGVAKKLAKGETVVRKMTFAEGMTSTEIIEQLKISSSFSGEITVAAEEGSLLPETYHYGYGDPRDTILKRMRDGMAKVLKELWPKRAPGLPLENPEQALVLASIIERETPLAAERPLVARVFFNRMKIGMPLQSDPTVIYALTEGKEPLDRALTRDDLKGDSPYNTYVTKGLPPTPIANPGRASIEAALNPGKTDALYFVADGKGGHVFAKTLDEHNKNVRRWRKINRASD